MAKDTGEAKTPLKAVPDAREPNDYYDQLDQEAKDVWDGIGALGFTPYKGKLGMLFARRTGTSDTGNDIGPADTLLVLKTIVQQHVTEEERLLKENGSDKLPGMEEPATEELDRMADKLLDLRQKAQNARANLKYYQETFQGRMNDLNRKCYTRNNMHIILEDSQKVTYKEAEGASKQQKAA